MSVTPGARTIRFGYEQGVIDKRRIKTSGPKLTADGGMITIEFLLFDPEEAPRAAKSLNRSARRWTIVDLPDGLRYAVWWVVFTNADDAGKACKADASRVIKERLERLKTQAGA